MKFIHRPLASTIDEFKELALGCEYIIPEQLDELLNKVSSNRQMWTVYQSETEEGADGVHKQSAFGWIQNHALLCELFYHKGMSAESIIAEISMPWQPDAVRGYIKKYFRPRTKAEKDSAKKFHRQNTGNHKIRYDLIPAEDEMIRLYLTGMSAERIALEFACSPDLVRKVLVEHSYYTAANQARVMEIAYRSIRKKRSKLS